MGELHLHNYACGRRSGECKHIAHIFQNSRSFRQSENMRMEVGFPPETNKGNPSDVSLQTDCNLSAGALHCQQITNRN